MAASLRTSSWTFSGRVAPPIPERLIPLQGELNPTPVDLQAKAFGEGECLSESEARRQVGERLLKRLLEQREGEHGVFNPRRRRSSPRLEDTYDEREINEDVQGDQEIQRKKVKRH